MKNRPVVRGTEVLPCAVEHHDDVGTGEAPNARRLAGPSRTAGELDIRNEF